MVECLPVTRKVWVQFPAWHKPGMLAHTRGPSARGFKVTFRAEARLEPIWLLETLFLNKTNTLYFKVIIDA